MKIAYVAVRGFPLSDGIASYTDGIAREMVKRGHEVTVYTSRRYGNTDGIYDNCYRIITVPSIKNQAFEKISLMISASLKQMSADYDIVHFHGGIGAILSFVAPLTGKARVAQSHSIDYNRDKFGRFAKIVLRTIEKIAVRSKTPLLVVSNELQRHFLEQYGKKSVVIHNGVSLVDIKEPDLKILNSFDIKPNEYYLYIARITKEKGLHYLLNAFSKLETEKKLIIAGPIDANDIYHQELLQLAQKDPRVKFIGFASGETKENLFRGAYAYCLPSESEGFSMALLEAMSYEKCCIVSDIPNNIEATGDCCVSFKSKDEGSLLKSLQRVEEDEELKERIGRNARKRLAENFTWDILADQVEKLYSNTIQEYKKQKKKR